MLAHFSPLEDPLALAHSSTRRGLTLLEVAVSIGLLLTMLMPLYLLMMRSRESVSQSSHYRLARVAAETVIERMRAQANSADVTPTGSDPPSFETLVSVWAAQRSSSAPWANVFSVHPLNGDFQGRPGNRFFVRGLPTRLVGSTVTPHGEIVFPTTPAWPASPTGIDETIFGLDLDGNGTIDAAMAGNVTGKYRVMPVTVRVFWGRETTPKYSVTTLISKRANYLRDNE